MKRRATILGAAVSALLGLAVWALIDSDASGIASAGQPVPSEARASGGTVVPPSPAALAGSPAGFPIMQATTPALVREVLRITRQATLADRPALLDAALHAEDPLVAGNAAKALGRLRCFSSDEALLAMTSDRRLRVRQDAVKACGLDGRQAALPFLERALSDGDISLRPLILDALGKIGGRRAHELVSRIAEDPESSETELVFARAALEQMAVQPLVTRPARGG